MSTSTLVWVVEHSTATDPLDRLVLIVMAYGSGSDDAVSYRSLAALADEVRVDPDTVERRLHGLEADGHLERLSTGPVTYRIVTDEPSLDDLDRLAAGQKREDGRGREWRARVDQPDYLDVLARDPCCYCGAPFEHYDHIHPQALGGAHTWANLTASCARCNISKRAKPLLHWLHWRVA